MFDHQRAHLRDVYIYIYGDRIGKNQYILFFLAVTLDPEKKRRKRFNATHHFRIGTDLSVSFKNCYIFCNDSSSSDFWVIY